MQRGNCAEQHPSIFFPSDGVGVERAKKLCEGCVAQSQCLEYALVNRVEHGVGRGVRASTTENFESSPAVSTQRVIGSDFVVVYDAVQQSSR